MSVFGYAAAGALQGLGTGMKERALAKREAGLELVRQKFALNRDQTNRDFQRSEREASQDFQKELAQTKSNNPDLEIKEIYDNDGRKQKVLFDKKSGSYQDIGGAKAEEGGFEVTTADGTTVRMGGKSGKLSEQESKSLVYYERATGALPILDDHEVALTNIGDTIADSAGIPGNFVKSEEYKLADQAAREFLAAVLRKDTGAAITAQEMVQYGRIYLPMPGDTAEVLKQKKEARHRALEAIRKGLGSAQILAAERPKLKETSKTDSPDSDGWQTLENGIRIRERK